jgi:hypothetical protein
MPTALTNSNKAGRRMLCVQAEFSGTFVLKTYVTTSAQSVLCSRSSGAPAMVNRYSLLQLCFCRLSWVGVKNNRINYF